MPRRAAQSMATALAWAVPITVRTLCWLNTRSTATNSGRCSSSHSLDALLDGDEPVGRARRRRGAHDADAEHRQRAARDALDDADAAPGQPRVHAEHPHDRPSRLADSLSPVPAGYRLAPTTPRRADGVCPRRPVRSRAAGCRAQASTFSMTSSETSKLAKTFCTSSLSSSASISLKILRAPSSSSSTCMVGTKLASAES